MELHNSYTVRGRSGGCTAFNNMADDFWQKAAIKVRWAKYLALTAEDGERVSVPATLSFINADPAHGGVLRAQYTAAALCAFGKRYVSVALCCENDAGGEMSVAAIDYTGDGEEAAITALICLETATDGSICFCAGDNPLVRRLLGCGEQIDLRIGWGTCTYPARVCARTTHLIQEFLPATVTPQDNGVAISSQGNTRGYELVLFSGEKALLRALRPYTHAVYAKYFTVTGANSVLFDENLPEEVFNVRLGDTSMLRLDVCRVAEAAVPVYADSVRHLGAAGQVLSDPAGKYVAVVTASSVEVYEVDSLELTSKLRLPHAGEHVFMCRGGAVALWSDTKLTIYEQDDNGVYSSFEENVPRGNACIVLREGARYHCAYRRSASFYRFWTARGSGMTQCEQVRVTTSRFVLGRCGDAILFGDNTLRVRMIDLDLSDEYGGDPLQINAVTRTQMGVGDCFSACRESEKTTIYDYVHNEYMKLEGVYTANGRLLYNEQGAYVYDYYNGAYKLEGEYDMTGVTGACLAGDGLFVVADNKLYTYYVSGAKLVLRVPGRNGGKTLSCNVRVKVPTGLNKPVRFLLRPAP